MAIALCKSRSIFPKNCYCEKIIFFYIQHSGDQVSALGYNRPSQFEMYLLIWHGDNLRADMEMQADGSKETG